MDFIIIFVLTIIAMFFAVCFGIIKEIAKESEDIYLQEKTYKNS